MQASVLECEVLERDTDGRGSLVRMRVDAKIRKLDYVVRYSYDLPHSLSWDQESGDLKENTGKYTFVPRADGGTDVTVDITAEVGFFVPGPMKNLIREQSLKNSMRELKKRVES
ncbi:MAG: SRPBCC family protein [Actinomycetota bacterium]|nr:SRPBCC family protein [Actinomycetota bacterium]